MERNRYIDFLRAAAILMVVIGHWLVAAPYVDSDGVLTAGHLLADLPWTRWLTWLFQVMPVFFLVGGYANAASWHSAHPGPYGHWLQRRVIRLLRPVAPLMVFWSALVIVLDGVFDPSLVGLATQAALVPVWFLATYLLVAAATPWTVSLWKRWGWWSVAAGTAATAMVDLLPRGAASWLNYVFVWGTVHQLGYAWREGRLRRAAPSLAGLGAAGLAGVVGMGWYPVSMVGVPGAEVNNTVPPRLALLLLGFAQTGLLSLLEDAGQRALRRTGLWMATIWVNLRIMSIYLWHLTAMVLTIGAGLALGGLGLGLSPGSAGWWCSRPFWLLVLAIATSPFVALFARFERPHRPSPRPTWLSVLGTLSACSGLGWVAYWGLTRDWWGPVAFFIGALASGVLPGGGRPNWEHAGPAVRASGGRIGGSA